MDTEKLNGKKGSKILMTLSNSTGTWLNGCLQKQHAYVTIHITDPEGAILADVGLSFEQASRMMLYNGDVDCTLQRYRNMSGDLIEEVVEPPKTVKERMFERLEDVESSLAKRLEDIKRDLSSMVNGHSKPNKTNLEDLLNNIKVIQDNLKANRNYVAQETEKELSQMQSNIVGQIGLFLQNSAGVSLPNEALKTFLPVSDGPLLIGEDISPVVDNYELKERTPVSIEDMTPMEVGEALQRRLSAFEKIQPVTDSGHQSLAWAWANHNTKGKVSIRYVSYQSDWLLDLDKAKEYLAFLRSITKFSEFKCHFTYFRE